MLYGVAGVRMGAEPPMVQAATIEAVTAAPLEMTPTPTPAAAAGTIEQLTPQVIGTRPHDTSSFTEGFELVDGILYESAGLYGKSTMRRTDPMTGAVLQSVPLDPAYFAEGIAVVGDTLFQMTWKEDVVLVYDAATLKLEKTLNFDYEGWGLCYDGTELWQSDGTPVIHRRDPQTFEEHGHIAVTYQGQPVDQINELECVGDELYANIWQTNVIVRISKATGDIDAVIDASGLLTPEETANLGEGGVLNGIAYNPDGDDFLITGKLWPKTFEVKFVPVQ
jgi:glutaminyl-peptide cyclotransferase